jgi:hypothetical protein
MTTKSENIKNYYKQKAKEKYIEERKKLYKKSQENNGKNNKKEIFQEIREKSYCKYGNYNNNIERAFHNCFNREKNFKGYIDEFIKVIEKSFVDNMCWDNYGEWEIDHIIPLAKEGTHCVTNIQALWKNENRKKRDKIM